VSPNEKILLAAINSLYNNDFLFCENFPKNGNRSGWCPLLTIFFTLKPAFPRAFPHTAGDQIVQ